MHIKEGLTIVTSLLEQDFWKNISADSPYSFIAMQTVAAATMILLVIWIFCFGASSAVADAFLLATPKRGPNFLRNLRFPVRSRREGGSLNSVSFWQRWRRRKRSGILQDEKYTNDDNTNESDYLDDDDLSFLFEDDSNIWDNGVPFSVEPITAGRSIEGTSSSGSLVETRDLTPDVTHFCFLIHGHRGLSKDLRYMQAVMRREGAMERKRRWKRTVESTTDSVSSNRSSSSKLLTTVDAQPEVQSPSTTLQDCAPRNNDNLLHDIVVHSAVCNEHKTMDGVRNGGERLVEEMIQVICEEMDKRPIRDSRQQKLEREEVSNKDFLQDVTISVVGNSLGGLFGRYAIAKLVEQCTPIDDPAHGGKCWVLKEKYRIHFNIFCTTATPHLGISGHTYVQIPRAAEIGVAHALGDTGKDLFRLNDLIHTMATCPSFLRPLASFRKRIAYANAYGTDFPVPASTAAFLSESSTYPHHFVSDSESNEDRKDDEGGFTTGDEDGDESVDVVDDNGLIIATLHTPASHQLHQDHGDESNVDHDEDEEVDELHRMSKSLDRLGWKKVFVDMRYQIPSVELPQALHIRRRKPPSPMFTSADHDCYLQSLRQHSSVVQSKDVASAVAVPPTFDRLSIPLGHNMMVAFSRSPATTSFYKGGRPVVDVLAKELVRDIFSWNMNGVKE